MVYLGIAQDMRSVDAGVCLQYSIMARWRVHADWEKL